MGNQFHQFFSRLRSILRMLQLQASTVLWMLILQKTKIDTKRLKMQLQKQTEMKNWVNSRFLKNAFFILKIMNLDNGNIFCITKNVSLLKNYFSRGWRFSIFYFVNFYAKPLFSMSLISMKNPKIVIFSWFYYLFSLI